MLMRQSLLNETSIMTFLLKLFQLSFLLYFSFDQIACGVITTNEIVEDCNLPQKLIDEIASYEGIVNKIINATTNGRFKSGAYNELRKLVDKFGARVSGTKNLEDAIDYMLDLLKKYKLDNVHGEDVSVPHWVRGHESAQMLQPRATNIPILGLGFSVPTPPEGITAEVLVVQSFDELNQKNFSSRAKGKIIVFNNEYVTYGISVRYRSMGATRAAQHGGVVALVRSVTPFSISTLHTGMQSYSSNVTKIPVASITVEHARMFQRLQDAGEKIVLTIKMDSTNNPPVISRNTVAEIQGSSSSKKVVIVSGHLDSWDVGVGAMDDGGGAFISWYSLAVLRALGLQPKRTLRAILWTGEEFGLVGAAGYNKTHAQELDDFMFVMESDEGTFNPQGLSYQAGPQGGCIIKEILKLFRSINATEWEYQDNPGSDITIFTSLGIPGASLKNANERYFWFHHSAGDTMDLEDPDDLDRSTALWAASAYILADLSIDFPREVINKKPQAEHLLIELRNIAERERKLKLSL